MNSAQSTVLCSTSLFNLIASPVVGNMTLVITLCSQILPMKNAILFLLSPKFRKLSFTKKFGSGMLNAKIVFVTQIVT